MLIYQAVSLVCLLGLYSSANADSFFKNFKPSHLKEYHGSKPWYKPLLRERTERASFKDDETEPLLFNQEPRRTNSWRDQMKSTLAKMKPENARSEGEKTLVDHNAPASTYVDKIIIVGDSLSDRGRLFQDTQHKFPDPKHYTDKTNLIKGRYTNGRVWTDFLDQKLGGKVEVTSTAYIGATSGEEIEGENIVGQDRLRATSMLQQLQEILSSRSPEELSSSLVVIFIGSNDLLMSLKDPDEKLWKRLLFPRPFNVLSRNIEKAINKLQASGASLVIFNLPEYTLVPAMSADVILGKVQDSLEKLAKDETHVQNDDREIAAATDDGEDDQGDIATAHSDSSPRFFSKLIKSLGSKIDNLVNGFVSQVKKLRASLSRTDAKKTENSVRNKILPGLLKPLKSMLRICTEKFNRKLVKLVTKYSPKFSQRHRKLLVLDIHSEFKKLIASTEKDVNQPCFSVLKHRNMTDAEKEKHWCKDPEKRFFMDVVHPTEDVHERIADYFLNFFYANGFLTAPTSHSVTNAKQIAPPVPSKDIPITSNSPPVHADPPTALSRE
ncbi:hypothetical protein IWQ62_005746, partial [Dispira parvispora]